MSAKYFIRVPLHMYDPPQLKKKKGSRRRIYASKNRNKNRSNSKNKIKPKMPKNKIASSTKKNRNI